MTTLQPIPETREQGFTLLEVLVALTILGLSLGVLLGVFSQSVARLSVNESLAQDRTLAKSLLVEELDPQTAPVSRSGRTTDGLNWTVSVARYGSDEDAQSWPAEMNRITVTVEGRQKYSLTTLRLGAPARTGGGS